MMAITWQESAMGGKMLIDKPVHAGKGQHGWEKGLPETARGNILEYQEI